MSSSRLEASDYPSGFRTYVLLLELRRTVGSLGLDTAHDIGEFRDQWNSSWIPTEADIPFEDLEKDFGFPTPDNLNDALRLFDIQDFLGEIRMQMQNQVVDPEALLSELVGRRGGLAHGSGPTPKFDTVRRLRKFTLQLTDHIDRNLRAAIDATTPGQAPW